MAELRVFDQAGESDGPDWVIRIAPPLVIKREESDWAFERIKKVIENR